MKFESVERLRAIFLANGWGNLETEEAQKRFDKFCTMFSILNEQEAELILNLTSKYLVIRFASYEEALKKAFPMIDDELISAASDIFLIPIVAPNDNHKWGTKSAPSLSYPIRRSVIPTDSRFKQKSISDIDTVKGLSQYFGINVNNELDRLFIFFDDFVGTGDTFLEFFHDFNKHIVCEDSDSHVAVFLAGQEKGIQVIEDKGVQVACPNRRGKGLSEDPDIEDVAVADDLMKRLERRLAVPHEYRFGYGASEALVTMIRTPDNTFPVFWWKGAFDGNNWPSPFPR